MRLAPSVSLLAALVLAACGSADAGRLGVDASASDAATETVAETTPDAAPDTTPDDAGASDAAAPDGDAAPSDDVPPPALSAAPTTTGTEFWVGFMENLSLAWNGPPTFAFFVSAEVDTIGHVEVPQTGYSQAFAVGAGEVGKVVMPAGVLYPQVDELPSKLGVHLTTDQPVGVVAVHFRAYFTEATRVLPVGELGADYVAVTAVDLQQQSPSTLVVVATEDGTTVELTPSTVTTGYRPAGVAQRFALGRGQTLQVQAGDDLSGTRVRALGGERLAVFAGARQAHIGCVGADSHLWDQMIPVARWGTRYVVQPLAGAGATPVKIVADRFKTSVDVACQGTAIVSPGRGELVAIAQPTVLVATQPIGVAVLTKSKACMALGLGDPNLLVVPPVGLVTSAVRWVAMGDYETFADARHWVSVVTAADTAGALRLDGAPIDGFAAVPGAATLVAVALEVAAGPHRIDGGPAFQAMMHGLGDYEAYTFGGGWGCAPAGAGEAPSCAALGAPVADATCDPGDLRLDPASGGDPDPKPPEPTCADACQCYAAGPVPAASCPGDMRPIWSCVRDCVVACGSPCEACAERFPPGPDGRCP